MKNRKTMNKNGLAVLAIGLLTSSSWVVMSATYDPLKLQQNNFNAIDKIAPSDNESGSSSLLESLQQAEINNKKSNYREVLNFLQQNKLKGARDKISALLKQTPDDSELYNLQALLEAREQNTFAVQQSYQKALQLNPKNILANLGLAK